MRLLDALLSTWRGNSTLPAAEQLSYLAVESAKVPTYRESLPELRHEISRARRYMRPLSMMVLRPVGPQVVLAPVGPSSKDGNGHAAADPLQENVPLTSLLIGAVLRDDLRESDRVFYLANRNCYCILMTESSQQQAQQAAARLNKLLRTRGGVTLRTGVAEFPTHGWTLDELLAAASQDLAKRPGNVVQMNVPSGGTK